MYGRHKEEEEKEEGRREEGRKGSEGREDGRG